MILYHLKNGEWKMENGKLKRLNELNIGESGIIRKIYAKEPLKSKLLSMGFARGERVKVLKHTLAKNTFDVDINGVNVALRGEEASEIEVEKSEK